MKSNIWTADKDRIMWTSSQWRYFNLSGWKEETWKNLRWSSHNSRLKAIRMNAQAMWPNERPQNERTKAVNERTNKITHERTNKLDNRTSEMPAKQTENGLIARTNARKPGNSTNGGIHLSLFKINKRLKIKAKNQFTSDDAVLWTAQNIGAENSNNLQQGTANI